MNSYNSSLTNELAETFNFGILNGKRGFFTDSSRGADSFYPFSGCDILIAKSGANCTTGETLTGYSEYIVVSTGSTSRVTNFTVSNGTKTQLLSGYEINGYKTNVHKIVPTSKDSSTVISYGSGIEGCFIIGY